MLLDAQQIAAACAGLHDAVFVGLRRAARSARRRCCRCRSDRAICLRHGSVGVDQVVREVHEERRIAHGRLGAQHGVAEAQRRGLADVDAGAHTKAARSCSIFSSSLLPCLQQQVLEFAVGIEMIFDGALGRAGDEHQAARAGGQRLFHRILNEWFVDDGQHLLGLALVAGRNRVLGRQPEKRQRRRGSSSLDWHKGSGPFGGRNHTTPAKRGSARA